MSAKLYGPLVQTLQQGADQANDPDLQAELWAASARVLETQLHDPGEAIEAWRHALDARPDDETTHIALERLLAASDRQAELAEILEKHLTIVNDPAVRKDIAKRTARLYDQSLKQRDRAIEAWRVVTEIDDADPGRLYVASLAWRDLAGVLQRKIEITTDESNLRVLRLTSARLHDERLGDSQEALAQLRAVLETTPTDGETLEFMDRILSREGQHADLLDVLDRRAAIEDEPAARDTIAMRAAGLLADELSDLEGAIGRYRQIVERSPDNVEAREALWRTARGEELRSAAIAALEPLLRSENAWADLVELLDLKISIEDAPGARVLILSEIATIEETRRGLVARVRGGYPRAGAAGGAGAPGRCGWRLRRAGAGLPGPARRDLRRGLAAGADHAPRRALRGPARGRRGGPRLLPQGRRDPGRGSARPGRRRAGADQARSPVRAGRGPGPQDRDRHRSGAPGRHPGPARHLAHRRARRDRRGAGRVP